MIENHILNILCRININIISSFPQRRTKSENIEYLVSSLEYFRSFKCVIPSLFQTN